MRILSSLSQLSLTDGLNLVETIGVIKTKSVANGVSASYVLTKDLRTELYSWCSLTNHTYSNQMDFAGVIAEENTEDYQYIVCESGAEFIDVLLKLPQICDEKQE